ncbi:MAG: hypothetical protein ACRDGA_04360, partial [Bacteroidota bacterium]
MLNDQLNLPYDIDINFGADQSDPNDDYVVVANYGGGNILVLRAGDGTVAYSLNTFPYFGGMYTLNFPISVAVQKWATSIEWMRIYAIDSFNSDKKLISFVAYDNLFGGPVGDVPQQFPDGASPSKIILDGFEAWGFGNLWIVDERSAHIHKFSENFGQPFYLSSFGSNGFSWNQFNSLASTFIMHNYTTPAVYLSLFTIESYTDRSGGRWYYPGSDIVNLTYTVSPNSDYVMFDFISIGNPSNNNSTFRIKNSSGQVIDNLTSPIGQSAGTKVLTWGTNGNYGNFTLEIYLEHAGGVSSVSTTLPFTVPVPPPPPAAPTLASPANGATNISISPTLQWNVSSDASSYALQVSTSSSFSPTLVDQSGITGTSYSLSGLTFSTTYYWRVNASNAAGTSAWPAGWAFTTVPPPPAAPVLLSPANGATDVPSTASLEWNASSGATSYTVEWATDQSFTIGVGSATTSDLSHPLSSFAYSTTFYWRVKASNAGGSSPWSETRSFTTAPSPPPVPAMRHARALISGGIPYMEVEWYDVIGETKYRVYASTDNISFSYVAQRTSSTK